MRPLFSPDVPLRDRLGKPAALLLVAAVYLLPWGLGGPRETTAPTVQVEAPRERRVVVLPPEPEEEDALADAEADADAEPVDEAPAPEVEEAVADALPVDVLAVPLAEGPAADATLSRTATLRKRPIRRAPVPPVAATAKRKRPKRDCTAPEEIATLGPFAARVEDSLVDHYARNPLEAEELAASWWKVDEEGNHIGVVIGRMKCDGLLRQAGFRNGDVILAVNGMSITSWAEGIEAFLRLRHKHLLWVDVDRKGERVRLDYLLVGDGEARLAITEDDRFNHPTLLVDRELELAELPWLARKVGRVQDRRDRRELAREERRAQRRGGPAVVDGVVR